MNETATAFQTTDFGRIFNPHRLAIVGISKNSDSFANKLYFALQAIGFNGDIALVNPKGGEFDGRPIYPSVADIPETIDLAVIAVVAKAVPQILEACHQKGAAAAIILSSGFKELGTDQGIALEKEIVRIARRGIRVIGPNCFGIYCPQSGLTMLPGPDLSRDTGPVAFSSQSGGMSMDFANTGKSIGLSFSKVVSFGNGADLRETELLAYFGGDPQTGVVAMYIEGVSDGQTFFTTLKQVTSQKPVVIFKGGLSEAGSRAVLSHTASMGGSREIWRSILSQANAVQVQDMPELARTCLAFTHLPKGKTYRAISVLGGGGALGVAAADAAESVGLQIPPFSPELTARIDALLPKPGSSGANPVDVANPHVPPEILKEVLLLAATDIRIDLQIVITLFSHFKNLVLGSDKTLDEVVPYNELATHVADVMEQTGKPVVVIITNPKRGPEHQDVVAMIEATRKAFLDRGVAVFDDLREALQTIAHVNTYYRRLKNSLKEI